jgi:hypothetical protein
LKERTQSFLFRVIPRRWKNANDDCAGTFPPYFDCHEAAIVPTSKKQRMNTCTLERPANTFNWTPVAEADQLEPRRQNHKYPQRENSAEKRVVLRELQDARSGL